MKRLIPTLLAVYLTVGQNYHLMLGNGNVLGLDVEQEITKTLTLHPYGSIDNSQGFKDRAVDVDLVWSPFSRISFTLGMGYDKYTLAGVRPIEDTDIHTAIKGKIW